MAPSDILKTGGIGFIGNRLNGSGAADKSQKRPLAFMNESGPGLLEQHHPAKRSKLDVRGSPPPPDLYSFPGSPHSSAASRTDCNIQGGRHLKDTSNQPNQVQELRRVDEVTRPRVSSRKRKKPSPHVASKGNRRLHAAMNDIDPICASDTDDLSKGSRLPSKYFAGCASRQSQASGSAAIKTAAPGRKRDGPGTQKRSVVSDDELSFECHQQNQKRSQFPLNTRNQANASHSTPIMPRSQYPTGELKDGASILRRHGLKIHQAVSGNNFFDKDEEGYEQSCYLLLRDQSTTLQAVSENHEEAPQYQWISVDCNNIHAIKYHEGDDAVAIYRTGISIGPAGTSGRLLVIKFFTKQTRAQFITWAKQNSNTVTETDQLTLANIFGKQMKDAKEFSARKRACASKPPIDLQLLEQKEQKGISNSPQGISPEMHDRPKKLLRSSMTTAAVSSAAQDPSRQLRSNEGRLATNSPSSNHVNVIDGWSVRNTEWQEDWPTPLVHLRMTVEKGDVYRLDEGEMLNDNIINFYLRFLQEKAQRENDTIAGRVYFHNSFFYEKLRRNSGPRTINYDGVKSWTSKIDLFSYDYIVVPVNENFHWYLAIICNPSQLLPQSDDQRTAVHEPAPAGSKTSPLNTSPDDANSSGVDTVHSSQVQSPRSVAVNLSQMSIDPSSDAAAVPDVPVGTIESDNMASKEALTSTGASRTAETKAAIKSGGSAWCNVTKKPDANPARRADGKETRIVTLDSLSGSHSPLCTHLKKYLIEEIRHRKAIDVSDMIKQRLGTTARNIPLQDNFCDCGVYLLGYMEKFLEDPDKFLSLILNRDEGEWAVHVTELRERVRGHILDLRRRQRVEELQAHAAKQAKRSAFRVKSSPANLAMSRSQAASVSPTNDTAALAEADEGFAASNDCQARASRKGPILQSSSTTNPRPSITPLQSEPAEELSTPAMATVGENAERLSPAQEVHHPRQGNPLRIPAVGAEAQPVYDDRTARSRSPGRGSRVSPNPLPVYSQETFALVDPASGDFLTQLPSTPKQEDADMQLQKENAATHRWGRDDPYSPSATALDKRQPYRSKKMGSSPNQAVDRDKALQSGYGPVQVGNPTERVRSPPKEFGPFQGARVTAARWIGSGSGADFFRFEKEGMLGGSEKRARSLTPTKSPSSNTRSDAVDLTGDSQIVQAPETAVNRSSPHIDLTQDSQNATTAEVVRDRIPPPIDLTGKE